MRTIAPVSHAATHTHMLLDCPACARSYHVSRAEIGDGREVICPRCEASWYVDADGTSSKPATPAELQTHAVSARPELFQDNLIGAARPRRSLWRRTLPALASAACLLLAMGLIGAREEIVRLVPRGAALYARIGLPVNLRGLKFAALTPVRGAANPADLSVSGTIHNVAQKRIVVPKLRYEVRDAAGEPLASWTEKAPARMLGAGKSLPFVSSPHALPPEGRTIFVRFVDDDPAPTFHLARRLP